MQVPIYQLVELSERHALKNRGADFSKKMNAFTRILAKQANCKYSFEYDLIFKFKLVGTNCFKTCNFSAGTIGTHTVDPSARYIYFNLPRPKFQSGNSAVRMNLESFDIFKQPLWNGN